MQYQGLPVPVPVKFAICMVTDLFDFTLGRAMIGIGTGGDVINSGLMFFLWGPAGLLSLWEAIDVTEQLDGFVPTNTLIAWMVHRKGLTA